MCVTLGTTHTPPPRLLPSFGWFFQPEALQYRGFFRLTVFEAPNPSTILWENLEVGPCGQRFRKLFVNFASLVQATNPTTPHPTAFGHSHHAPPTHPPTSCS